MKLTQTIENGHGLDASIATAGGSPTITVSTSPMKGDLVYVYVKALTATTTFTVTITDSKGRVVLLYTDEVGTLRDRLLMPVEGKYSVKIDASVAEAFTIMFKIKEAE